MQKARAQSEWTHSDDGRLALPRPTPTLSGQDPTLLRLSNCSVAGGPAVALGHGPLCILLDDRDSTSPWTA